MLRCAKAAIRYGILIFSEHPKNSLPKDQFGHLIKQDALSLSLLHVAAYIVKATYNLKVGDAIKK
jgi:hypothetical protein